MRSKISAVLVAAVLGIVCGVVASYAIPRSSSGPDPLGLGTITLKNLSTCSGQSVLMLAWGSTSSALGTAAADTSEGPVHYLRPDSSCPTIWKYQPDPAKTLPDPEYVAYLGPFPNPLQACNIRMTAAHKGDFVTRLRSGNTEMVQCACFVDTLKAPELSDGMSNTTLDSIWIRQLQEILVARHDVPDAYRVTGIYDAPTRAAVEKLVTPTGVAFDGVVNTDIWRTLLKRACSGYTS